MTKYLKAKERDEKPVYTYVNKAPSSVLLFFFDLGVLVEAGQHVKL